MFPFNITTEHLYTSFLCITLNINKLSAFLFFGGFVLHFSKKNNQKLLSFTLKKTKVGVAVANRPLFAFPSGNIL